MATTPLVQAALSYYIAKRDFCLAELDIYLNRPVGVGEHATVSQEVIRLFADLDNAESVIRTIRDVISGNQGGQEVANLRDQIVQEFLRMSEENKNSAAQTSPENTPQTKTEQ